MAFFTREAILADLLVLAGLVLVGAALWSWLGWTATLGYAGTVLLVIGLVLAWAPRDEVQE